MGCISSGRMKIRVLELLLFIVLPLPVKLDKKCQRLADTINGTIYQASNHYWPLEFPSTIEDVKNCGLPLPKNDKVSHVGINESNYGISLATSTSLVLGNFPSSCLTSISLCSQGLSVSFWIKPFNTPSSTEPEKKHHILGTSAFCIIKSHDKSTGLDRITVEIKLSGKRVAVDAVIKYDRWNHVGMTWANGVLKIYVNGTMRDRSSDLINEDILTTVQVSLYLSSSPVWTQSSAVEGYNMYSDLAIWYQKLSSEQMYEAFDIRPRCSYIAESLIKFSSTTSSHFNYRAEQADTADLATAWCGKENENGTFLQLQLDKLTKVCTITTYQFANSLMTRYAISSSTDGVKWSEYYQVIQNYEKTTIFRVHLPRPVMARYLRVHPLNWTTKPCIQVQLSGCQIETVKVKVVTEGFSDPGVSKRTPICSIKVNRKEECPNETGHNIVILDLSTGHVTGSKTFDTSSKATAAKEMAEYITSVDEHSIIIIAVKGSGHRYINESAEVLYRIGAVDPLVPCEHCSWILIGRNGSRKAWVEQTYRLSRMGPAVIDVVIPLEENNNPKHWLRLDKAINNYLIDDRTTIRAIRNSWGTLNYNHFKLDHRHTASMNLEADSCLLDPDKCPGGITIAYWMHQTKKHLSAGASIPSFKVLESEKDKCFTWLTNNESCCVFPFVYRGVSYTSCTEVDHYRLWCSLTPLYQNDDKWGDCLGCNRPLVGVVHMLSASTSDSTNTPRGAMFKKPGCWSPSPEDTWPYLQVNTFEIVFLTAIATKGGRVNGDDHWVKSYRLWYTFGGISWMLHREGFMDKDFIANWDSATPVTNQLEVPVKVRTVRIVPLMHTGKIALKLELYGCPERDNPVQSIAATTLPKDCDFSLGLESGKITAEFIEGSTVAAGAPARYARLNGPNYWSPSIFNEKQYLIITFQDVVYLTAVATQGALVGGTPSFVSSYWISSSNDKHVWQEYTENDQLMVFTANVDAINQVKNKLKYPFEKHYLRIHPKTWNNGIALRAEVYGCLKAKVRRRLGLKQHNVRSFMPNCFIVENPKFSIVGPVIVNNELKPQNVTVSYKYCTEGLPCPACERQLYIQFGYTVTCLPDVGYFCNYTDLNFIIPVDSYTHSIKVFDVIGLSCYNPIPPGIQLDVQKIEIIGHVNTELWETMKIGSCYWYLISGHTNSGFYVLWGKHSPIRKTVYCDMTTQGGGWTVIQKRFNNSVNFFRDWRAYVEGFGSVYGEYWIGLDYLAQVGRDSELRVELETFNGERGTGFYEEFGLTSSYELKISGFEGDIGDSLSPLDGVPFSTWDKDTAHLSCSNKTQNGWWNNDTSSACITPSNLNGRYDSMTWQTWKGSGSLKKSVMKVRPAKVVRCSSWACYYIVTPTSPSNAINLCTKFGATVVSITSEEEYTFIKNHLKLQTTPPESATLGLTFKDNVLQWSDGAEFKYQANYVNTTASSCFALLKKGSDYKWSHFDCKKSCTATICKRGITCHQRDCFYDFTGQSLSCHENEALCTKHNSKMTKIYNKKKDDFITKFVKNGVHTGMMVVDGVEKWPDGSPPYYKNWNPTGQPRSPFCVTQFIDGWIKDPPSEARSSLCENPLIKGTSCAQLLKHGVVESGVYSVNGDLTYCDQEKDGGGWEVIQRRVTSSSSENFNRTFVEYENGFGNKLESFWLGNRYIHSITKSKRSLLVNLVLSNDSTYYAFYEEFAVLDAHSKYRLYVSGYKGTAGDYLSYHTNMMFSSSDRDRDMSVTDSCAARYASGWWFNNCSKVNLNAQYSSIDSDASHIHWGTLNAPIKYVEMKIKSFYVLPDSKPILKTETANQRGFSIYDLGYQNRAVFKTSDKYWELLFTPSLSTSVHVCITWSPAIGIRYYENGRLTASNDKYKHANLTAVGTTMYFGEQRNVKKETSMKRLGFWFRELQPYAIQEVYNYDNFTFDTGFQSWSKATGRHSIVDPYFDWSHNSGCTPSIGTGPCTDHTLKNPLGSYIFMEASSPKIGGNYTVIQSPYVISGIYKCLRFFYHMRGTGEGSLHVSTSAYSPHNHIFWQMVQNNRDDWQLAEIPLRNSFSRIYFFGKVNKNFESDIAIDDVSFDTKPCVLNQDCNPPCLKETQCNNLRRTCNCGKLKHVDDSCRSILNSTIFIDVAHYWSFENHTAIEDSKEQKIAKVNGNVAEVIEGVHNNAIELKGQSSWINFGTFSRECLGDFSSCGNGLTVTVWLKHFAKVEDNLKQKFLSLGNVENDERGFEFGFDPTIQQGELPLITIRVNFPDTYCQYKIPIPSQIWSHLGFSFEDANTLNVYRNGKLVDISRSQACKSLISGIPASAVLRAGSPTQNAVFHMDELVIWNKWLEQKDYMYRYRYIAGGLEQNVNLLLKLKSEVWDEELRDLESPTSVNLTNKIIESFQAILGNSSSNGKSIKVIIHGYSEGSVNANVTLLFESLTYNDTLLLERWLFEQNALNTIPVSVLGISSNTVPDVFPVITTKGKNDTAIYVNWTIGNYTSVYQLFQGYRILYKRTDQPTATFLVHDVIGAANYTVVSDMISGVNYTMRLLLYTLSGDGLISPVFFATTKEDVPNEIPGNPSGINTSTTTLNFTWSHIGDRSWRGIPLGYRIKYWSPMVPLDPVLNITVPPDINIIEINSLRKYMLYCLTVTAFNAAGDGNYSDPVCIRTEEDVPDAPLEKITFKNVSSTEIQITSPGVPFLNRNGIITKYVVYWSSQDANGEVICINATLITCELKGLKSYTAYNISVTSYTRIGVGVISNFSVYSDEHVPSLPPFNIHGHSTSSSSIIVSWSAIPADHHHGIFRGYHITHAIKGSNKWENTFVCHRQLSVNLTKLSAYREYEIIIAGFTSKGNGNSSESIFVWTDQDTPFSPPVNITGTNVSSTSLQLKWEPVPYEYARGIILGYKILVLGYRLAYRSISNDTAWNVTINDENVLQRLFTLFEMYTDYTFQLLAFTIKGEGNVSEPLTVRTDEDKPFKAPTNVTLKSDVWHSIEINWTRVPPEEIPGICRGYIIFYIRKEGSVDVLKNMTVAPTATTAIIPYLSGFIIYGVWISAFTYLSKIGPTANITIKTEDWLPRISPPDFSGVPISSTSLGIRWKQLPLELTNGIMVGYVVEYNNTNKSIAENATFPTEQTYAVLTGLRKFNYYKIRIVARNVNGFGNWSEYITLRTDEDVPEKPPSNSTAASASPTSVVVRWNPVPLDYRHGFITGYTIFYRPISEADEPVPYSPPKQIDLGPTVYEWTINGLTSYTEYSIEVLAQTVKGEGVKAATITGATCRCFEEMKTNWRELSPYVRRNGTDKPIGMMPRIIEDAVYECCRECPSHANGRIKINFTTDGYGNPANKSQDIIVKTYIDDQTDLSFPIFAFQDQKHFSKYYAYVPIVPSAGVAFIVSKMQSLASPQNVANAIFSCWPLIMFNLISAFLVGLIVWMLDSNDNPDHFHESFIRGVASGFWFAFTTYTTVGYGDKTVVSIPARIFTVFWTLFGLVTFGIMMGALSAALETMTFNEMGSPMMLYGAKVAVIDNSSEHRLGLQKNSKVNTEKRYETLEDLRAALLRSEVKGALIDAHIASYRQELFQHPVLRVNKIYESNKAYGVVLAGPTKKIQKCMVHYMSENRAWIHGHIKANSRSFDMGEASVMVDAANDLIDSSSNVFMESRNSMIILLSIAVAAGLVYEAYRWKNNKGSNKYKVQPVITDEIRSDLNKLILEMKENIAQEKEKLLRCLKQNRTHGKWKYPFSFGTKVFQ